MIAYFGIETSIYLATALVVFAIAGVILKTQAARSCCVITANWAAVWGFNVLFGTYTPWVWFIVVDAASAFRMLKNPASKPEIVLATLYMAQIAVHFAFGMLQAFNGFPEWPLMQLPYWWGLLYASFAQLAIVALWSGGHGLRRYHPRRWLGFAKRALPSLRKEVEG